MRLISIFLSLFVSLATFPREAFSQEDGVASPLAAGELSVGAIEDKISAIVSEDGLDDLTRGLLLERYEEALDSFSRLAGFQEKEAEFREAIQNGPREKEEIESERNALVTTDAAQGTGSLNEQSSEVEIQTNLSRQLSLLSQSEEEEKKLEAELAAAFARPTALRDRLFAAQGELKTAQSDLEETSDSAGEIPSRAEEAEMVRLDALRQSLAGEIAMLEQEDASQEIRVLLLEARQELVQVRMAAFENRIESLRDLASRRQGDQFRMAVETVEEVRQEITEVPPLLQTLENELNQLSEEIERSNMGIRDAEVSRNDRDEERQRISEAFDLLERELDVGGGDGSIGQLLVERLRMLPSRQEGRKEIERIRKLIMEVQSDAYELERALMEVEAEPPVLPESLKSFEEEIAEIRETRESLRSDLQKNYRKWIRELSSLELTERQVMREVDEYRDSAVEKIFWVRDSRIEGTFFLRGLRDGLHYCFGWHRWKELGSRLSEVSLFRILLFVSLVAVLFLL
ncbi:MAG: hypothetical protein AAF733_00715, partial [Verrucomicrobiota bacterium]